LLASVCIGFRRGAASQAAAPEELHPTARLNVD